MITEEEYALAKENNCLVFPYANLYEAYLFVDDKKKVQEALTEILTNNSDLHLALLVTLSLSFYDEGEAQIFKELLEFIHTYLELKGYTEEC